MSVYNKLLHAEDLRLLGGIIGAALMATAINLFIVPQGFYAGGAYGMCQVIRTLLVTRAGLTLPFDLAGLLYLMVNLPLFYLAYRGLGRTFFLRATVVTVCNSIFLALIPSPATPIITDPLTSCMIGGIGVGFAAGGGVAKAVEDVIHRLHPEVEVKTVAAEGLENCRKMLRAARTGKYDGYLLEGMGCPGGCIGGAGTIADPAKTAILLNKYVKEAPFADPEESPFMSNIHMLKDDPNFEV